MIGKAEAETAALDPKAAAADASSERAEAERRSLDQADFGGPPLERRPFSEQIANRIMAMIKSGNLKSGDQLPTEAQMTVAFGVSRPALREALKALTIMGLLESRQGGRYTVSRLSASRLVAPLNAMLGAADYDVDEHFEARDVVEVALVRLCAKRADSDMRGRILKLAADGRAFLGDAVGFRLLDIAFHESLYLGAANPLLSTLAAGLYDLGLHFRRVASASPGVIEKSVRQHVEVAEAVAAGDSAAAAFAYRRHLEHVRDTTVETMAQIASRQERA